MKFGLDVIIAWSKKEQGVKNPARFLLEMGVAADEAGWDGFFLWDHITFPWTTPLVDPFAVLAAVAGRTKRIRFGTTVTPLPRRRPQVVARQLATLDNLSKGRAILGVGLGEAGDFTPFGEEYRSRLLAEKVNEALEVVTGLWRGEPFTFQGKHYKAEGVTFLPRPIQKPRIPIWIGGKSTGALRRAARYDGWVVDGPSQFGGVSLERVSESIEKIWKYRGTKGGFDVVWGTDLPDDEEDISLIIKEATNSGVTWLRDRIYGLRFSGDAAMERVRAGPPDL
jgi:alkanesulfonate monooxygenase SsuD/methylene tetrahydromethanopterin reductase-like flavin-dependent oxidoreductase (luciferase family)